MVDELPTPLMPLCFVINSSSRRSRPEAFCKNGVLRNLAKFTGKHLCHRLFSNKVAGLRPATVLKKILRNKCFPVNFAKFLRTPFFTDHLRWLLLILYLSLLCASLFKFSHLVFQRFDNGFVYLCLALHLFIPNVNVLLVFVGGKPCVLQP